MAALVCRHAFFAASREISPKFLQPARNIGGRIKPVKPPKPAKDIIAYEQKSKQIDAFKTSLQTKGFLRKTRPYTPPSDVVEKIQSIAKIVFPADWDWHKELEDNEKKFQFLTLCWKEFNHDVPNSMLAAMRNLDDISDFYQTEVITTTPLDAMKKMDLPPNLHIQYEAHRFHPETDTMFGGVSAFPKSSTVVTGLKTKKKYQGYKAKIHYD